VLLLQNGCLQELDDDEIQPLVEEIERGEF
jgi:hypothetical protein